MNLIFNHPSTVRIMEQNGHIPVRENCGANPLSGNYELTNMNKPSIYELDIIHHPAIKAIHPRQKRLRTIASYRKMGINTFLRRVYVKP